MPKKETIWKLIFGVLKIIRVLFRTLRHKDGILSAKSFINIADGKNFVKAARKSDGSYQIKKVISQAEGFESIMMTLMTVGIMAAVNA